jgi:predicted Co/Zn/Cd cation transporter (cation efflux family)
MVEEDLKLLLKYFIITAIIMLIIGVVSGLFVGSIVFKDNGLHQKEAIENQCGQYERN